MVLEFGEELVDDDPVRAKFCHRGHPRSRQLHRRLDKVSEAGESEGGRAAATNGSFGPW